jgi:hypothetical protein
MIDLTDAKITSGITLYNHVIVIVPMRGQNDYSYPLSANELSYGDAIKTPIGDLHLLFYDEICLGRLFNCKYHPVVSTVLHHSEIFYIGTSYQGEVYSDSMVSIHCNGSMLIVTLPPDVPMDGDSAKFDADDE